MTLSSAAAEPIVVAKEGDESGESVRMIRDPLGLQVVAYPR